MIDPGTPCFPRLPGRARAALRILVLSGLLLIPAATARGQSGGAADAPSGPPPAVPDQVSWLQKLNLSGLLNVEGRWLQHGGLPDRAAHATSSLYIRQFNLGIEARLLQGASATVVLNSEWIGDELTPGDGTLALDEIHLDLEGGPRFAVGRQTQPFGQFESDLVTDPMTQAAYETKQVGVTLGFRGPRAGELAFTAYKGTPQMDQLFQSGLFDTTAVRRRGTSPRQVDSFVVSLQAAPWPDHLTLFGAWLSEPGSDRRNTSADGGLNFVPPRLAGLNLNVEFIHALTRELYLGAGSARREGVVSAALSYAFVVRERRVAGRRGYQGRRSSNSAHPVVATVRAEFFDDDGLAAAAGTWALKSRTSLGARYALRNDGSVLAYLQGEVRRSSLRTRGTGHAQETGAFLRLGMDF